MLEANVVRRGGKGRLLRRLSACVDTPYERGEGVHARSWDCPSLACPNSSCFPSDIALPWRTSPIPLRYRHGLNEQPFPLASHPPTPPGVDIGAAPPPIDSVLPPLPYKNWLGGQSFLSTPPPRIDTGMDDKELVRLGVSIRGKVFAQELDARRKAKAPAEPPPPAAAVTPAAAPAPPASTPAAAAAPAAAEGAGGMARGAAPAAGAAGGVAPAGVGMPGGGSTPPWKAEPEEFAAECLQPILKEFLVRTLFTCILHSHPIHNPFTTHLLAVYTPFTAHPHSITNPFTLHSHPVPAAFCLVVRAFTPSAPTPSRRTRSPNPLRPSTNADPPIYKHPTPHPNLPPTPPHAPFPPAGQGYIGHALGLLPAALPSAQGVQ